jgi:hypothetical protein
LLLLVPGSDGFDFPQFGLETECGFVLAMSAQFLDFLLDPAGTHPQFLGVFLGKQGERREG